MLFGIRSGSRLGDCKTTKYLILQLDSRAPRGRVD